MASYKLLVLEGSPLAQKGRQSAAETLDFLSVRVGANNLEIKQLGATSFDFSALKIGNLAAGTLASDALRKDQAILVDGSQAFTGNQAMGGNKLTGLAAGSGAGDSVRYEQAILATGVNAFSADQSMGGNKLTSVGAGTAASDAVNKGQLDAALEGLKPKAAARVATTANITIADDLNAGDVIDGITLANGDRVLVKNQTAAEDNGIYVVSATPTRSTDFDSLSPIDEINGSIIAVEEGTDNAGKIFVQSGAAVATLGTDPINFVFFNSASSMVGGDGVTVSGNNISVDHDGEGLTFVANQLAIELDGATLAKGASGLKVATGGIADNEVAAGAAIAYSKLALTSSIVNADIAAGAAIAYSKLALSNSIVNADIAAGAAIAYSKLNLATSIVNADIAVGAAIAYSKLALANSIVNADIAAGAAIAYSKLALTNSLVAGDYTDDSVTAAKLNADVVGGDIVSGLKQETSGQLSRQDAVSRTNDNAGSITVRQAVYFKANGAVDLARANAAGTINGKIGFVEDATIATTASGFITSRRGTVVGGFTGLTVGANYYVSATSAGEITDTAPSTATQFIRKIGEAISATQIELNPEEAIEIAS